MNIIETGLWNSFYVEISNINKAKKYVQKFYEINTNDKPPRKNLLYMFEQSEWFGGNLCDMNLKVDCDVKYEIKNKREYSKIPPGIWVYSHRIENRRPQIEYLKTKWKEFTPKD